MDKKIMFRNKQGYKLIAILKNPQKKTAAIVIFSHGLSSGKDSSRNNAISDALIEKGIATFLLDFTGHGESEGSIDEASVEQMAGDLGAAIDYIEGLKEFKKIGISGSSLGGTVAILTVAADKRISAMVLRAPPSEGYYEHAKKIKIPVMILQGIVNIGMLAESRELLKSLGGEKKLEIIEGASHLFEGHMGEMVEKTVLWFMKWLK
ncbi:MAG: alpha/beta fold hydrolase [Nanoarchaeota archaeon]|nr:alpha/beta fold hydrolase [Nanoarchaeota archaeon]